MTRQEKIEELAQLLRDRKYLITPSLDLAEFMLAKSYQKEEMKKPEPDRNCDKDWFNETC